MIMVLITTKRISLKFTSFKQKETGLKLRPVQLLIYENGVNLIIKLSQVRLMGFG